VIPHDPKSPLSWALQALTLPKGFKMPQIASYDGKTNVALNAKW
jgi:hypothetical protein